MKTPGQLGRGLQQRPGVHPPRAFAITLTTPSFPLGSGLPPRQEVYDPTNHLPPSRRDKVCHAGKYREQGCPS